MSQPSQTATPTGENDHFPVSPNIAFDVNVPDEAKTWFPMRIAHGRPERVLAIRDFLNRHKVENFLPLTYREEVENGRRKRKLVPAINNLIFIRTAEKSLIDMKRFFRELLPLRFMMWTSHENSGATHIIRISDHDMQNFIRVASLTDDRVIFLGNKDFSQKIGKRVRITDGIFAGTEGTVYRVRKNRHVVISLDKVCSVAIAYINPNYLQEIEEV